MVILSSIGKTLSEARQCVESPQFVRSSSFICYQKQFSVSVEFSACQCMAVFFFVFFFLCHQENVVDRLLYSSVNRILLEHKNLGTIKPFSFGVLTLQEFRDWKMSQNLTAGNKDTMLKTKKILPASSTGSTV